LTTEIYAPVAARARYGPVYGAVLISNPYDQSRPVDILLCIKAGTLAKAKGVVIEVGLVQSQREDSISMTSH